MAQNFLILASASPRRAELLTQIGVSFTIRPADIDERLVEGEGPAAYVLRLAGTKARAVAKYAGGRHSGARHSGNGSFVLGADTIVVVDEEVLGKPANTLDAAAMLTKLAGREHQVITGVALAAAPQGNELKSFVVRTKVRFRQLTEEEISAYVRSGEPMDKAGAYGIQGLGGVLVESIEGNYSTVVGLPLAETFELLSAFDIDTGLSRQNSV